MARPRGRSGRHCRRWSRAVPGPHRLGERGGAAPTDGGHDRNTCSPQGSKWWQHFAGSRPAIVRTTAGRRNRARSEALMTPWVIEPLASSADIDGILHVEEASFTNPWTREMYEAELRNEGTAFFYLARDNSRRVVGFCSCWRVLDELHINNLAVS